MRERGRGCSFAHSLSTRDLLRWSAPTVPTDPAAMDGQACCNLHLLQLGLPHNPHQHLLLPLCLLILPAPMQSSPDLPPSPPQHPSPNSHFLQHRHCLFLLVLSVLLLFPRRPNHALPAVSLCVLPWSVASGSWSTAYTFFLPLLLLTPFTSLFTLIAFQSCDLCIFNTCSLK